MNKTSSNDPTSCLMTTSDASPTIQKLQRIKDIVVHGAFAFSDIKSPEAAYNENVANKQGQINERFRYLRKHPESDDEKSIEDEIVRYAGELQILKDRGRADAQITYYNQVESILQSLSDELILTIGSGVVKRSLEKIPVENRKQYLPDDGVVSEQAATTEPQSILASTDLDKHHGEKPITVVLDPVQNRKRRSSYDTEQYPASKRQTISNPEALSQLGWPLKEQNVSDATVRSCRRQCGEVGISDRRIRRQENEVALNTNGDGFEDVVSAAFGPPVESMAADAAVSPPTGYDMTTGERGQNTANNIVVVCVNDADNNRIGHIKQVGPWNNERVDTILRKPVLRPVKIRQGRPFNQDHLAAITDRSETKGAKIVSCMIQATGDVMDRRCRYCEKNWGTFEDCIKLNDESFRRCGNCEWSSKRCRGASILNAKPVPYTPSSERLRSDHGAQNGAANPSSTVGQATESSLSRTPAQNLSEQRSPSSTLGIFATHPCETPQTDSVVETSTTSPLAVVHEALATHHWAKTISEYEGSCDEFHTQGFSDADSYTGAAVTKNDWRIHQIKTRFFTSAESITQYWSWVEEEQYFEHQVLKDTKPVQWGLLREPINFDVQLKEIAQVKYNVTALRVHLVMKDETSEVSTDDKTPRGDVMVVFKRTRTVRRFLSFLRRRNFSMVKEPPDVIVHRWRTMESEVLLSDGDDDTN